MSILDGIDINSNSQEELKIKLRKQYGRTSAFSETIKEIWQEKGLPDEKYSLNDLLELASIYTDGREGKVTPNYTEAMYYAGQILLYYWKDAEIYVPSDPADQSEIDQSMKSFWEGHDLIQAKQDLLPLAEEGYPYAVYAMRITCDLLGQKEEYQKWKQLDEALNPAYDHNPASLFCEAVRRTGNSLALQDFFELVRDHKGTPAFPGSVRLMKIIETWLLRLYQYEGYRGSGFAFYQLYKMYDEINNKKQADYWRDQACFIGYAPARESKCLDIIVREFTNSDSGYVNADDLELAARYAQYAIDAGLARAKDKPHVIEVIKKEASRKRSIDLKIETMTSNALKEYREKLDQSESFFNFVRYGAPFTAEELEYFGIALHDAETIKDATLQQIGREASERDYIAREMRKREEGHRREFMQKLMEEK